MNKTKKELLKYMTSQHKNEKEQLQAFLKMISKIFTYVTPPVPNIDGLVLKALQADTSIQFSLGVEIYDKCLTTGKIFLGPPSGIHIPPPNPFVISPPAKQPPDFEDVADHISNLMFLWFQTGQTPAAPTPVAPLILT